MKLLAIDTAANLCAACVFDTAEGELGRCVVDLGKGHAEHLISVIEAALQASATGYADLDAVAVSIGPGSFTGIRVGVATARGFALALDVPAIGVTSLEAMAAEAAAGHPGLPVLAAIDARRGEVYVQLFDAAGDPSAEPQVVAFQDAVTLARSASVLTGSAAEPILLAAKAGASWTIASTVASADIAVIAGRAAAKGPLAEKPRPLYLRPADAKPQTGTALPRRAG